MTAFNPWTPLTLVELLHLPPARHHYNNKRTGSKDSRESDVCHVGFQTKFLTWRTVIAPDTFLYTAETRLTESRPTALQPRSSSPPGNPLRLVRNRTPAALLLRLLPETCQWPVRWRRRSTELSHTNRCGWNDQKRVENALVSLQTGWR